MNSKIKNIVLFDVGQGDHILIEFEDNTAAVIDFHYVNSKSLYPPAIDYLLIKGITKLHFIHVTHYHKDHIRGLNHFIKKCKNNNIEIDKVYIPSLYEQEFYDQKFLFSIKEYLKTIEKSTKLSKKKLDAEIMSYCKSIKSDLESIRTNLKHKIIKVDGFRNFAEIDSYYNFLVFHPDTKTIEKISKRFLKYFGKLGAITICNFLIDDEFELKSGHSLTNELSSYIKITAIKKSDKDCIILASDIETADLERVIEKYYKMADSLKYGQINSDFIKISHHGAKSSSSELIWKNQIKNNTKVRIGISAGKDTYPSEETLEHILKSLDGKNTKLEITATNKDISLKHKDIESTDKMKNLFLKKQKNKKSKINKKYEEIETSTFKGIYYSFQKDYKTYKLHW